MDIDRPQKRAYIEADDDSQAVRCGGVGFFRARVPADCAVRPGQALGELRILGRVHDVVLDPGGRPLWLSEVLVAQGEVEYGQPLFRWSEGAPLGAAAEAAAGPADAGLRICAPQPGRAYLRPEPGKPPYAAVGQEIQEGDTLALVEIMKTFSPLRYEPGRSGLPPRARLTKVLVEDGQEVELGDPLFEIEAA